MEHILYSLTFNTREFTTRIHVLYCFLRIHGCLFLQLAQQLKYEDRITLIYFIVKFQFLTI